ncbi:MAG TPA: endolytic transglycosylase MltG [bacterium (Candidatus Stahlbacteria)]|nr:endolytic transglycosylase MltG [Candidatus Stahlbacteria bacterium]
MRVLFLLLCCIFIFSSCSSNKEEIYIEIEKGESLNDIAKKLKDKDIIDNDTLFKLWARITGNSSKLKAGRYAFRKHAGIRTALKTLVEGKSLTIAVTIPEGYTLYEIAELFERKAGIDKDEFLSLAHDTSYIRRLGLRGNSLEGFLYPDTYFIYYGIGPSQVIEVMVRRFFKIFSDEFKQRSHDIGLSMEEVVTLASLIEKEAKLDSEKFIISSVYHNRLKMGRLLECDATIQYILPKRKERLLYKDLKIDSPYNTYLYPGLPPGPICSPGRTAIRAALWPRKTDYLYFVARGDGTHIFSKTLKEHIDAKRRVKRNR